MGGRRGEAAPAPAAVSFARGRAEKLSGRPPPAAGPGAPPYGSGPWRRAGRRRAARQLPRAGNRRRLRAASRDAVVNSAVRGVGGKRRWLRFLKACRRFSEGRLKCFTRPVLCCLAYPFGCLSLCKIIRAVFRSRGGFFLHMGCLLQFAGDTSRHHPFSAVVSFSEEVINAINLLSACPCFIV